MQTTHRAPGHFLGLSRTVPTIGALLVTLTLAGCANHQTADQNYTPVRAQHGKDVIWIPTPDLLVEKMLTAAKVGPNDVVYDLGAGDGKIAIAAAKNYGARAIGIEYNPQMAEYARQQVKKAGVSDKVTIITGDIFVEDFSKATVVTLYLLNSLNLKLKPKLLDMPPGTRIVSNTFSMGSWIPDQDLEADGNRGFFWIVPAKVDGTWEVEGLPGIDKGTLRVVQKKQFFEATLKTPQGQIRDIEGRLRGKDMVFTYKDPQGQTRTVVGVVDGKTIKGSVKEVAGSTVSGTLISP